MHTVHTMCALQHQHCCCCRVWFVGLGSVPGVAKTFGYTEVHAQVLCIAWLEQAKAPLLLVSLTSQTLLGLSPDLASAAQGGCAVLCSLAQSVWYSPSGQGLGAVQSSLATVWCIADMFHMFKKTACAAIECICQGASTAPGVRRILPLVWICMSATYL